MRTQKINRKIPRACVIVAAVAGLATTVTHAGPINNIFYIELENHNWTQPGTDTTAPGQIMGNPAAPYINSLIQPNTSPVAGQISYASQYHNVLATPTGSNPSIHPSEPNYLWQESGTNFGIANDNDPYAASNPTVGAIQTYLAAHPGVSGQNLSGLLQAKGISWKSYQEGIDLAPTSGTVNQPGSNALTNTVAPLNQWTVPTKSFSGTSANYTNPYNNSHQYNYAVKHDGSLFFTSTNGGTTTTPDFSNANPETTHYAPTEQLQNDLNNNTVARYSLITPDQFNDMHTGLSGGFDYNGQHFTGDQAAIATGDKFLSVVVPQIMASQAYQNNGAIVIWTDETEGTNANDFNHTLLEFVISPLSKGSITSGGVYNSTLDYTHSSDLATLQEIFQAPANSPTGYLNDAANPSPDGTMDLSDMFVSGTIPSSVPEPTTLGLLGLVGFVAAGRRKRAV